MPVLALNQQQPLGETQFVATFTGLALDDSLVVSVAGEDIVFRDASTLPFVRVHSRTSAELRVLVLTDLVPAELDGFSFQVRAASTADRAWILNGSSNENYQNYGIRVEAGKTLELLEFGRLADGWFIRTKNQAIGEQPLPPEHSRFPEHLRELALAARGVNTGAWSQVHAFVEVNEVSMPHLSSQLYLDTLAATQAIAASAKVPSLTISYGAFGEVAVPVENRVDEAHRAQLKTLAADGYSSGKPSVEQLRGRVEQLAPGGVLMALVTTIGGFDKEGMLELLEKRDAHLILLAMRSVFGSVPALGGSERLQGFAVANLDSPTPRSVVDLLRSKN
jgi:hypothetical protein